MRVRIQLIVSCVLVGMLGFFYGYKSSVVEVPQCEPKDNSSATLDRIISVNPTGSRYVFVEQSGCSLLVYAPRFPVLVPGTVANISGKQEKTEEAFSSLPEYAEYVLDSGVPLVVRNAEVKVLQEGSAPLGEFRLRIAENIGTLFREPNASLINAMITGDQGMIPQDIKDMYRKSGITHILSISGLHVSVIALCLTFVIGFMRVRAPVRSVTIFGFLWVYIITVGSPASAVRAGVFWTCYVLAYHIRALTGVLTVILLTLAILLTHSPLLVQSIGFQLSVTAVCGIGIAMFFLRRMSLRSWGKGLATLFAVSLGATLTTAPLTLYYFGSLSLIGFITNALVVPLLPMITYLVLVALLLHAFFAPLALVLAFIVDLMMKWVVVVAVLCSGIPYGNFEQLSFPVWGIGLYYSVLFACIVFLMRYFKISWREWWV